MRLTIENKQEKSVKLSLTYVKYFYKHNVVVLKW